MMGPMCHPFALIAVLRMYVFRPRVRASTSWVMFIALDPEKAPSLAKAMNECMSLITVVRAAVTELVKFVKTLPSSASMLPSWIDCVSRVLEGQIAFATPGACFRPLSKTDPAVAITSDIPAPAPGAAMNARPAVSAVKRSPSTIFVFFFGSISVIRG